MGFHTLPKPKTGFTHNSQTSTFYTSSSGDNTLTFSTGNSWEFPDAIAYYIMDCAWQPPEDFINDVMNATLVTSDRRQTKSIGSEKNAPKKIGYLEQNDVDKSVKTAWSSKVVNFKEFSTALFKLYPELSKQKSKRFNIDNVIQLTDEHHQNMAKKQKPTSQNNKPIMKPKF